MHHGKLSWPASQINGSTSNGTLRPHVHHRPATAKGLRSRSRIGNHVCDCWAFAAMRFRKASNLSEAVTACGLRSRVAIASMTGLLDLLLVDAASALEEDFDALLPGSVGAPPSSEGGAAAGGLFPWWSLCATAASSPLSRVGAVCPYLSSGPLNASQHAT